MKRYSGFTLIEILAAVTLLGVIATILFSILFTSLRGAGKSDAQTLVAQNGSVALSQISRVIRGAGGVESESACAVDGAQAVPTTSITLKNIDGTSIVFSCNGMPNGVIASDGASLINDQSVVVTDCSFSCTQKDSFSRPVVTVDFTLNKASSSSFLETNSPQSFQTSVSLRNLL